MGKSCCGATQTIKYNYNGKEKLMTKNQAETIERYKQGAASRNNTFKMKQENLKEIADTPKPTWASVAGNTGGRRQSSLISASQFRELYEVDGMKVSDLSWNQYFEDIGEGRKYRGEWDSDKKRPSGLGIVKFADGSEYRGQFYNDKFNGRGQITRPNGSVFWGDWKDGKAQGNGTFFCGLENSLYEGVWVDDKQNGKGREEWEEGQVFYVGDYVNGKKTGMGAFKTEGSVYEGDFVEGRFHGKGVYHFQSENKVYEGDFQNN